jgi:hypothetical protein
MLVSMTVRCEHCGYESDARYRFCGMCGAKLPPPPPPSLEPIAAKSQREEPVRRVSGPSFLGLTDEPASPGAYLLEDEVPERHWGRYVVLLIILGALGAAGWHWRTEVRAYVVARMAQRPSSNQGEQASSPAAPVSTSPSETALQTPNASTPVNTSNTGTTETSATPAAAARNPAPPANNPAANIGQPGTAPAAPPAQTQPTATPPPAASAPSGTAETATANEEAAKPEAAVAKGSKSKVNEAPAASASADQLEAEGERYLYGTGVSANCSRAERDLQAAAEQGSSKADSVLATMYATGHCVSRDLPLAYRWFAMALKRDPGNSRLQDDLRVLWNQMTPDERQIALRRQ